MKKNLFNMPKWALLALFSVLSALVLSGCASAPASRQTSRAPVEDRTQPDGQAGRIPTTTATTSRPGAGSYHTVNRGETLYSIARLYNVTVPTLVSANQLSDANQINVGQRLLIPGAGGTTTIVRAPQGGVTTTPVATDAPRETSVGNTTTTVKPNDTASVKPPATGSGNWMWPIPGGKVVTRFGTNGAKGIEISAPLGTPVLAAESGKVIFSSNNIRGYGNLIVVRHNSEYLTAYGYNSRLLVKEGDTVKRGDKIAEVGSSGTDSPKLHFEIRNPQSKPEDPLLYLPK